MRETIKVPSSKMSEFIEAAVGAKALKQMEFEERKANKRRHERRHDM